MSVIYRWVARPPGELNTKLLLTSVVLIAKTGNIRCLTKTAGRKVMRITQCIIVLAA